MNEKLRKVCRNYNIIINCEFLEDDLFSKKLVECYKNVVSSIKSTDEKDLNRLSKFDYVMRKYIEDYRFSKKLQDCIDDTKIDVNDINISDMVLEYASSVSDKYDTEKNDVIVNTKWI